jgi:hypothetical protein
MPTTVLRGDLLNVHSTVVDSPPEAPSASTFLLYIAHCSTSMVRFSRRASRSLRVDSAPRFERYREVDSARSALLSEQPVPRALHPRWPTVDHVGVDHRGPDVLVPHERLEGADVGAFLEQVGGEGVPESVAGHPLGDGCCFGGSADLALQHGLVKVVPPALVAVVQVGPCGREHPPPWPVLACTGALDAERLRQLDPAGSTR